MSESNSQPTEGTLMSLESNEKPEIPVLLLNRADRRKLAKIKRKGHKTIYDKFTILNGEGK